MDILFAAIFGGIIGSFLSVCIYRIPLGRDDLELGDDAPKEKIGITYPPRSFCPKCKETLKWYHNIPVFSWLALGGKCGLCRNKISVRYPVVELLSALFAVLSTVIYGFTPTGILIYVFACSLIVISFIDIDYYIIPNLISLPGTVIGIAIGLLNQFFGWFEYPVSENLLGSAYGILAGGGFLFLVSEVYLRLRKIEGLGMGDVKLLAMTGAFFGPVCALYTIFVGSLLGSVIGILLVCFAGRKMTHQLPFGPYLALGTLLFLFTDVAVVTWFSELFNPTPPYHMVP